MIVWFASADTNDVEKDYKHTCCTLSIWRKAFKGTQIRLSYMFTKSLLRSPPKRRQSLCEHEIWQKKTPVHKKKVFCEHVGQSKLRAVKIFSSDAKSTTCVLVVFLNIIGIRRSKPDYHTTCQLCLKIFHTHFKGNSTWYHLGGLKWSLSVKMKVVTESR